jgi:hypothetical protein
MTNHMHVAGYFPDGYKGTLEHCGDMRSIVEMATDRELPPILKRFGAWAVTTEGIHCLTTAYFVAKDRFDESDWIAHMQAKDWVNMPDFTAALTTGQDFVRLGII